MAHRLVKLHADRDAVRFQRLLERCSDYYELHEGWPTPPDAGEYELALDPKVPQGVGIFVFALEEEGSGALDAAAQVLTDYPEPGMWWIGLLIVAPELRSRGIGSDLMRQTLAAASDAGVRTIKLGVSLENPRGQRFWERVGFRDTTRICPSTARNGHVEDARIMVHDTPMSDDELAAISARGVAATPGRWEPFFEGRDHYNGDSFIRTGTQDLYISAEDYAGGGGHFQADLDFIAHARQDIPRLIAEIRRLQSLLASQGTWPA